MYAQSPPHCGAGRFPRTSSRARSPALEHLQEHNTSNTYWLSVLAQGQSRPDDVGRSTVASIGADLHAMKPADTIASARRWLSGDVRVVEVLPAEPENIDPF